MVMDTEKKAFAQAMIDGMDAGKAAFKVFPTDGANRMKAILQWEKDSEVIQYSKEILGIKEPIPDKREKHIEKLNEIFDDEDIAPRDRLQASMQIAQIEGFITEKKETNNINNKIIVITRSANDADWAKGIEQQQKALVERTIEIKQDVATD